MLDNFNVAVIFGPLLIKKNKKTQICAAVKLVDVFGPMDSEVIYLPAHTVHTH